MTLALPAARHRLANLDRPYMRVEVPTTYRPTSHRRRRTQLMQISVADLTHWHGPRRQPLWRRAGRAARRFLFEAFVVVFGSDDWRKPR